MATEYRVFGPPGTGKTTYVSRWIKQAAEKHNPGDIVVASLTRTAAAELAGRGLPIPKEQIGTLHSHCYRLLGRPQMAEGRDVLREWNKYAPAYALSEGGADMDEVIEQRFAAPGDALMNQTNVYRMRMRPETLWKRSVLDFSRKWKDFKGSNSLFDFTDLIDTCQWTGIAPGARIGFFDEVQDFTPLELSVIRNWGEQMDFIVMSGDDDQCIYGFAGATPEAFLDGELPEEQKRVLAQSYRVPRAVQELAERWIAKVRLREPKAYRPRDCEGEVLRREDTYKSPEGLFAMTEEALSNGKSVMFLTSCSYMLGGIIAGLRKRGLPFHNPYRRKRGDWNPLHIGKGVSGKDRLLAFLRPPAEWTRDDVYRWASILRGNGKPVLQGAMGIIDGWREDGEAFAPYDILKFLRNEDAIRAAERDVPWYLSQLNEQGAKSLAYPYEIVRRRGAEALREEPRITVGTIHSVKGGEADVVFLFPDLAPQGAREWSAADTRDAVVRQFYVGITRARETLVLCRQSGPMAVPL